MFEILNFQLKTNLVIKNYLGDVEIHNLGQFENFAPGYLVDVVIANPPPPPPTHTHAKNEDFFLPHFKSVYLALHEVTSMLQLPTFF